MSPAFLVADFSLPSTVDYFPDRTSTASTKSKRSCHPIRKTNSHFLIFKRAAGDFAWGRQKWVSRA